jgi:hypothetical protein
MSAAMLPCLTFGVREASLHQLRLQGTYSNSVLVVEHRSVYQDFQDYSFLDQRQYPIFHFLAPKLR